MNSLSWNKYSEIKPTNGSKCIVAVNSKVSSSLFINVDLPTPD